MAVQFYTQRDAFDSELNLYMNPVLQQLMPQRHEVLANDDGSLRSPSGFVFPPVRRPAESRMLAACAAPLALSACAAPVASPCRQCAAFCCSVTSQLVLRRVCLRLEHALGGACCWNNACLRELSAPCTQHTLYKTNKRKRTLQLAQPQQCCLPVVVMLCAV